MRFKSRDFLALKSLTSEIQQINDIIILVQWKFSFKSIIFYFLNQILKASK